MKQKIWLWNHYATDMYKNKGGRHYWFAENLIKAGYKPTVFCASTYHNTRDFVDTGGKKYAVDTVNSIPFVFVKTTSALGNGLDRIKNMLLFYLNLFSVAKTWVKECGTPDLIIASSVHPLTMVAGIQIAKKLKVPCICEVRDLWPEAIFSFKRVKENSLLGKLMIAGEHWIYRRADALVFTKEGDTDYIKERYWDTEHGGDIDLNKCHYINNGVDVDEFISSVEENSVDDIDLHDNTFKVVYVGSIRPVNNVENILDAAALLKEHSDIRFIIYGDGNQFEMLWQRIIDEGLNNVKMKGYIEKRFIPYILSCSSVNILNYSQSLYNWSRGNSSNKLFEYMASGKPVISTVKMGYCILDKYNCGLSIEEPTPSELARKILTIHDMPKEEYREMGHNGRAAVKDFDFKVLTQKLISVIEGL